MPTENGMRPDGRSEAIDRMLRETGPAWQADIRAAGDRVKAAYLPLLLAAPADGCEIVHDLPYGTQKLVELARAMALEPRLMLLDDVSQ